MGSLMPHSVLTPAIEVFVIETGTPFTNMD